MAAPQPTPESKYPSFEEALAPYRSTPFHLLIRDGVLREQLGVILALLGFASVKTHPLSPGYLEAVRRTAKIAMTEEGVLLIQPPLLVVTDGGQQRKELPQFFADLALLFGKDRRDVTRYMAKCAPVFPDIGLTLKREMLLTALARHGVLAAFILRPQEPLERLTPSLYKARMREQIMERAAEIGDYLCEYLSCLDGSSEQLQQKKEERELSQRKAEADSYMGQGRKAKEGGDWEKAIECFKKAIDLFPQRPDAYLESGRVYVHVRKYSKALLRFNQAEEVAGGLPEPNREIGAVRILQVQERIERGESPDSPAIMRLMEDALQHFEQALKKAERTAAFSQDEGDERKREAVARIAADIVKMDVKAMLGKKHPMVKRLGGLAWEAFAKVSKEDELERLGGRGRIFLGLAAMDEKNLQEAEKQFFLAAEDKEVFEEACNELIVLGIHVRKFVGGAQAILFYKKLLALEPSNRAAIFFNLAVAYSTEKNVVEAAGAIVQALYIDPTLAQNEMFYGNAQLNAILDAVVKLFARIMLRKNSTPTAEVLVKALNLQEKLENLILAQSEERAGMLLSHIAEVMPDFLTREHVVASKIILRFMESKRKAWAQEEDEGKRELAAVLGEILVEAKDLKFSKRLIAYSSFKAQALRIVRSKGDFSLAANFGAKAVVCHPEYAERSELYACFRFMGMLEVIWNTFKYVNRPKIAAYGAPVKAEFPTL
jgi:tetratricopeptide (TPR) repeat protein